jgi:hypothetical protein
VAPSGVGALMWTKAPAIDEPATVRYASFH